MWIGRFCAALYPSIRLVISTSTVRTTGVRLRSDCLAAGRTAVRYPPRAQTAAACCIRCATARSARAFRRASHRPRDSVVVLEANALLRLGATSSPRGASVLDLAHALQGRCRDRNSIRFDDGLSAGDEQNVPRRRGSRLAPVRGLGHQKARDEPGADRTGLAYATLPFHDCRALECSAERSSHRHEQRWARRRAYRDRPSEDGDPRTYRADSTSARRSRRDRCEMFCDGTLE